MSDTVDVKVPICFLANNGQTAGSTEATCSTTCSKIGTALNTTRFFFDLVVM